MPLWGGAVQSGVLFKFAENQHDKFGHNRFEVYDTTDTKIGEAGFGRQTGFVVWLNR